MVIAVLTRTAIDGPAYVMERLIDIGPRIAAGAQNPPKVARLRCANVPSDRRVGLPHPSCNFVGLRSAYNSQRTVPLEVVFAFVVGIAVALLWRRARAIFAARNQPPPAPADATVPTQRIQQLSEPLTAIAESSAHPRDLLENDSFREAVAILESDTVSLKLVTDYVGGANWPIATAACAALITRPDRAEALSTVVAGFRHCRPWPMYFVLRYFETLDERPPVGTLVLQGSEWWIDHPFIPGLLAEHFVARSEKGDEPSFGDGLARATAAEINYRREPAAEDRQSDIEATARADRDIPAHDTRSRVPAIVRALRRRRRRSSAAR